MAKHTMKHGTHQTFVGSMAVLVVVAVVGFLIMTNLRVNRTAVTTNDTAELIESRVHQVNELQAEVNKLSAQVDTLNTLATNTKGATGDDAGSSTMLPAVEGDGLTVTLNDSSLWKNSVGANGSSADIDKYVVHQQDVEAVVNALWAGGAEVMQIMDQRVLANSAIICSGNVLMMQGKRYSPPFTISAIGPVRSMQRALDRSKAIGIYKEYVSAFGLGYSVKQEYLHFDATPSLLQPLKYATVVPQPKEPAKQNEEASAGTN
ncbi:DUF881 domain-containing protein [Bifidobacterium gallicum]|uniref:Membrane protein n=1 Tax=Bifidobacterium gallicum DSM 20093 = LMG 11596 TaxID=561180 RepID=D1NW71_9BIFI|nr:DUF881 domain-containing protein [Bifidobacterium gallicum]EFA22357.1 hypothetical protein BIFGAL_04118 [Bifidobacterium gallicum DSM 20093 = LMG 11596]KFI60068.1 membrane protein [Bifidobacterium gallicum DSM 20093 = LMG 11596]